MDVHREEEEEEEEEAYGANQKPWDGSSPCRVADLDEW